MRRFPPQLARPVQAPARRAGGRGLETWRPRQGQSRAGPERVAAPLGSGSPAHGPRRLAGAGSLGGRHRPSAGLRRWLRSRREGDLDSSWFPRSAGAAAQAGRGIARRAPRRTRRTRPPRAAPGRPPGDRARDLRRSKPRERLREAFRTLKQAALPLSARGRRAVPRAGTAAPGRRHGPRQDRAGDRRLPRAVARRPRPPRSARRPRRAQAAVAARVAALHRRPRRRGRRQPRRAPRHLPARVAAASC